MKNINRFASIFVSLTLALTAPGLTAYEAAAQQIRVQTRGKQAGSAGVLAVPRIGATGGFTNSPRLGAFDLSSTLPFAPRLSPSVRHDAPAVMAAVSILEAAKAPALPQTGPTAENVLPAKSASDAGAPSAMERLDRTRDIVSGPKSEAKSAIAGKSAWDFFWAAAKKRGPRTLDLSGSAPRDLDGQGKSGLEPHGTAIKAAHDVPAASLETNKSKGKGKAAGGLSLFAGGAWMASYGIPDQIIQLWIQYQPYIYGLGILAGTRVVQNVVAGLIKKFGDRLGWEKNTTAAVNMMVTLGLWTGGSSLALWMAGVPTAVVLGVLSIGGVTIGLAAKDFIRNFLEAVKVLLTRPFKMGDKIGIDGKNYVAEDMTLHKFVLKQEDGRYTKVKHVVLAEKPITLQGPYLSKQEAKNKVKARSGSFSLGDFFKRLLTPGKYNLSSLARPAFWALASTGLLFYGLPALQAAATWGLLVSAMPFLQGGATLWLANRVSAFGTQAVTILAEKFGWSLQTAVIAKLAVRGLSYGIGGTAALRLMGVTWSALMTGGFAGSFAITWGAAGLMANFIEGIVNLMSKDIIIGKNIKIGGVEGKVIDLNINNVVIGHQDGSYTLIPHSLVKSALLEDIPEHALRR